MRLARKLFSLSVPEWRDLLRAQWLVIVAQVRLRTRPTGSLIAQWTAGSGEQEPFNRSQLPRAHAIGHAVRRVGLYGVTRAQCLARSIAICEMLNAEGIRGAIVKVGVRPQDARIEAHAWVELAGEIIGDSRAHIRGFELLASAHGALKR